MDESSGVGVLDKAALVLAALETGPASLAGLVQMTGLARPTAHRLARALEHHRFVSRDLQGRFILGPRLSELAAAAGEDRLLAASGPILARLRDITGESAQLYRRQAGSRVCAATAEVTLAAVRKRGWSQSVGEREAGVASVSAPVRSPSGKVIAAVSVSGPIERLTRQPGRIHAPAVVAAGGRLSEVLRRSAK